MGIPLDMALVFMILCVVLLLISIFLLFIEPTFNNAVAGIIISFINLLFSYATVFSLLGLDLYGIDYTGELVSNIEGDFYPFGIMFFLFVFLNVLFTVYGLYLLYAKPWKETMKSFGPQKRIWYEDTEE